VAGQVFQDCLRGGMEHLAPLCDCMGSIANSAASRRMECSALHLSVRQMMKSGGKCCENERMMATSRFQVTLRYRDFTGPLAFQRFE